MVNRGTEAIKQARIMDGLQASDYHWEQNTEASVYRRMRKRKGNSLCSAVDPETGELVTDKEDLFNLMQNTLKDLIGTAGQVPKQKPEWFREVVVKNSRLQGKWSGLLDPATAQEIREELNKTDLTTAPGTTKDSLGLYRMPIWLCLPSLLCCPPSHARSVFR
jgi:hypothetical protein